MTLEELGRQVKTSWDDFINQTPKDINWLKAFDAYMEVNKELYAEWNKLIKLKNK